MLDLVGQLQAERESFSRSEQRLADIVLADVEAAVSGSIVELAARAAISPPTVTRFCRRLGCQSFSEFKVRLAKSRFLAERYLVPATGPQTAIDIARHIVNCAQSTLYSFFENLEPEVLERAADRIVTSGYVLSFGSGGASSMMATEFETRLFRLGLRVSASIDHQGQMMRAAAAPRGTVVVGFSMSGRNLELARTLAIAGEYGLARIVLTRPRSPVAEQADIVLGVDVPEEDDILRPSAARYAFLAMVDVVAQAVATRSQAQAINSMRRIKHQFIVNRDGDDTQPLGD
ncbi:MAG TPA: MurR/RpiR family transcriptional regulator [Devosia sp.]|nr:MurR/RpiR family transcriptional regulator [Devosia sp.]